MTSSTGDREALMAVSPSALSAYARAAGWVKADTYGDHSDVYDGEGLPEIILPRTKNLGDYGRVVARLIEIFASVAELSGLELYRDLVTADRDAFRVRANADSEDGTVAINDGADLVNGARDALLAAACSLQAPRPLYRAGSNREASEFLKKVRLGQTEKGSFVVTLLTPVIPPIVQGGLLEEIAEEPPLERQITQRLAQALASTQQAMEMTNSGDSDAFAKAVSSGASANLCEALVQMIEPFPAVDVSVTWARTRPMTTARRRVRFAKDDVPILREAARSFRNREPQTDARLFGSVRMLRRDDSETDGTVTLHAFVDGKTQSVTAILNQSDYHRAIYAHREKDPVIVEGDLERFGQRWRLSNPRIVEVITGVDAEDD